MKKLLYSAAFILIPVFSFAQANCSNPVHVTLCPATYLTGQTNAGMLNDAPTPCNIVGEDLVYEIYAPNNAMHIYVTIENATNQYRMFMKTGTCNNTSCYIYYGYSGTYTYTFNVSQSHYYYLWIDAATTITYNISIGGDTSSQYVYIPSTAGNWYFDNCALNPFAPSKPYFEVSYNGVYQTNPMTMSPLNLPGTMCITYFLQNTTGVRGTKQFKFSFDPGYQNVSPVATTIPGFYNAGNWVSTQSGSAVTYTFYDSAGTGRGDFTGIPNTCLRYPFCFNITPISNSPYLTNCVVDVYSDMYGNGFSGYVHSGCCPSGMPLCLGGPGASATGGHIGSSFNDPGGTLPVSLLSFDAKVEKQNVSLTWETASEINNDYFTLEKSIDGIEWKELTTVRGIGNSTINHNYLFKDQTPFEGESFYRLSQTDFNGEKTELGTDQILFRKNVIAIYPNPAGDFISVESAFENSIELFNVLGEKIIVNSTKKGDVSRLNIAGLPEGIYFIKVEEDGEFTSERIVIRH